MSTDPGSSLDALRAQIDRIDDALLALVEERLATSAAIAARKDADRDGLLKLRPRREAAVVARMATRARIAAPALVEEIWRTLMTHGLQAQARTRFVLAGPDTGDHALEDAVHARFGKAVPVDWAADADAALAMARDGEVVAILPAGAAVPEGPLRCFARLHDRAGREIGIAAGRVSAAEALP